MAYHEDALAANPYKQEYLGSVERLIQRRLQEASAARRLRTKDILGNPEQARADFSRMLGWPLTEEPRQPLTVEDTLLSEENGIRLYRMKFEIFQGFFFYGLYFEHTGRRLPLVLSQHGKWGTPEVCSDVIPLEETNYHHMSRRILQRGAHVFAPQLLLWMADSCGIEYDRDLLDAKLRQAGGSVVALELYCLRCCISYFAAQPEVDETRMGMVGLSYARMRKAAGDNDSDIKRTERQRKLLDALFNNLRSMSFNQLTQIVNEILPMITTWLFSITLSVIVVLPSYLTLSDLTFKISPD